MTVSPRVRMPRRLAAIGLAIAAAVALSAGSLSPAVAADDVPGQMTPELEDRIQNRIEEIRSQYAIPGMSVAVVTPSAENTHPVVTTFAVGVSDLKTHKPVDSTTQFEIASQSKAFTADLLAYLVARGTVTLDDTVQQYAPSGITVPVWTDSDTGEVTEITLRDLATHRAGLPDTPENIDEGCDDRPQPCNPEPGYSPRMQWQALADHDLLWQPGTNWLYSNFGFGLLGVILANIVHPTPDEDPPAYLPVIQDAFLDDLGMTSTVLGYGPRIATPYTFDNKETGYLDDTNSGAGEGGLVSDADDMAIWVGAHLGYVSADAPLGVRSMADTLRQVGTVTVQCQHDDVKSCGPTTLQTGLAWQLYPAGDQGVPADWAFKNGGSGGFSSDTALAPATGVGVTVMWNQERPDDEDIEPAIGLLALILNHRPEPEHDGGDHGGHDRDSGDHRDRLAESGGDGPALLLPGLAAASLIALGLTIVIRRRTAGSRSPDERTAGRR